MEGAIESGKITANYILDKYNKPNIEHYKHEAPFYIKCIQNIDNIFIQIIFTKYNERNDYNHFYFYFYFI